MKIQTNERRTVGELLNTPIIALLTGKPAPPRSRRKSSRQIIADANLPEELCAVVRRVVHGTRLWPSEQADVAAELCGHFGDALEAGQSQADAAEAFGDARLAANLIRRAKLRQRGALWKSWRAMKQTTVVVALVLGFAYAVLAARLHWIGSLQTVDHLAAYNVATLVEPVDERAWPIYRQALTSLQLRRLSEIQQERIFEGGPVTPDYAAWLKSHEAEIAALRDASQKRALGYEFAFELNEADYAMFGLTQQQRPDLRPEAQRTLIDLPLPHLSALRTVSHLLLADADRATDVGDAPLARANFLAVLDFADQISQQPLLVSQAVALGIRRHGLHQILLAIYKQPEAWSDADLLALAHRAGRIEARLDFTFDRLAWLDVLQRSYGTDGRLSDDGIVILESLGTRHPPLLHPVTAVLATPYDEELALFERLWAIGESELNEPLWRVSEMRYEQEILQQLSSPWQAARHPALSHLMPSFDRMRRSRLATLVERDALLIGIALELFRRDHGDWPGEVDELSPRYLPAWPLDPFLGEPLSYRLKDGLPLVYSVGDDLNDDRGRPRANRIGTVDNSTMLDAFFDYEPRDGDVIYWPPFTVSE